MSRAYYFQDKNFIIENFAQQSAFTDFLPGIAGLQGRPVWAFFINRGQGIAGFGVKGKENPIMEFYPAETAYAVAPRLGFRTFLKIDGRYVEPFAVGSNKKTRMEICRRGFAIEEKNGCYNFRAEYFGVPNENYAALARIATYTNTTETPQTVEFLDGLAQILPYGLSNDAFKGTGNLFKSWMCVEGTEKGYAFYKMRSSTADSAETSEVKGGNFFLSAASKGTVKPVVDPKCVFGEDYTKTEANGFKRSSDFSAQNIENEYASAFAHGTFTLKAGESVTVAELFGYCDGIADAEELQKIFTVERALSFLEEADKEAEKIASRVETHTAYPLFDEYIKQSYFDNVLRGGMPVKLGDKVYYVFSRKHGDPERDYNAFSIEPQPYSCGNGNFRDVAQNRRNDIFITPECGDFNIKYFFSLLQLDGYNPLSVLGVRYRYTGEVPAQYEKHEKFLKSGFTVGELCARFGICEKQEIEKILDECEERYEAAFGEGYWTDHFVYLIDLLTEYLSVYPERREELLYETPLRWFSSRGKVKSDAEKIVLKSQGVRRLNAVEERGADGWAQANGKDFTTSLAAKILHLITIKLATLDPLGAGIDMEAEKPGWCDALNGLPAVFGSNIADALELKRLMKIFETLRGNRAVEWCEAQNDLFDTVYDLLVSKPNPCTFYEKSSAVREAFRKRIYGGDLGVNASASHEKITRFLSLALRRLDEGLARAKKLGGGWYPTYLRFTAEKYEEENGGVSVKKFKAEPLPHFAEGVAKGLALGEKELYSYAKKSELYDKELGLYKTSEPLDNESMEIGRIRSFPKGWLERESCFLHMNYKLMLSLLQAGLYDEFYKEIKTNFVPFMNPAVYGRSTIENSSFLATGNHSDPNKRGKGFQARLTGANAEVLSVWRLMMGISRPFRMEEGSLVFELNPVLSKDFFTSDGTVSLTLFGKTKITYHNGSGRDTYQKGVCVKGYHLVGEGIDERVEKVTGALAEKVRAGEIREIEAVIL